VALALGPDDPCIRYTRSHPAEAFHGPANAANPVLNHEGALSIVAPFFGLGMRRGLDTRARA
jgi:hypothetical protein